MVDIFSLLKGNAALEQIFIFAIASQLVGGAVAPAVQSMENIANSHDQQKPLSPDVLARLVIRNRLSQQAASEQGKKSGVSDTDFAMMVKGAGNPIGAGELADALRRGIITEDDGNPDGTSFLMGIRQGDVQDKWAPVIKKLATQIPTPNDILQALLEGQIERAEAEQLYVVCGGDMAYFQLLFNTRGSSPTPLQAAEMAHRGVIPWEGTGPDSVSYAQAFLEGPWRNKWSDVFRALSTYVPPPRTVTAMVHQGALTDEQAIDLWQKSGLAPDMAAAYLKAAHSDKLQAHKHLTLSIIEQLYHEQAIDNATAHKMVSDLGYSEDDTNFILSVQDLKRLQASIDRGLTLVHTNYVNHHVDRATALAALDSLGIASGQRDKLLAEWDIDRRVRVAVLTPTQIKKATKSDPPLITKADAHTRLVNFGYSEADATIFMEL